MSECQTWELGGVVFGPAREFSPGTYEVRSQDAPMPLRDGLIMGRDYLDAPAWTWTLPVETVADVQRMAAAWRPALSPWETVPLRYFTQGRWRRVYGRPRRFTPPSLGTLEMSVGVESLLCDFQLSDPSHYDDGLSSVTYSGVGQTAGGLVAPLRAPLSTRRVSGASARFVTVGGDAPTPLAVRFTGPSITPRLWTADGRIDIRLSGSIAYDQSVTIDARQQTVIRSDGASVPGMLSPHTRMADLVLPPGVHELFFSGAAEASVTVAWRNAWRSL